MAFHKNVSVKLTGQNPNVFNLLSVCVNEARKQRVPKSEIDGFLAEVMTQKDYDDAIVVCARWFDVH